MVSIACKCAYAVTFHKAQGLTLDALYIDLGRDGADGGLDIDDGFGLPFIPDSGIYLALSRAKRLEGIGLSAPVDAQMIHVNSYARLYFDGDRDRVVRLTESLGDAAGHIRLMNRAEHAVSRMKRTACALEAITGFDEEEWAILQDLLNGRASRDARELRLQQEAEENSFVMGLLDGKRHQ